MKKTTYIYIALFLFYLYGVAGSVILCIASTTCVTGSSVSIEGLLFTT